MQHLEQKKLLSRPIAVFSLHPDHFCVLLPLFFPSSLIGGFVLGDNVKDHLRAAFSWVEPPPLLARIYPSSLRSVSLRWYWRYPTTCQLLVFGRSPICVHRAYWCAMQDYTLLRLRSEPACVPTTNTLCHLGAFALWEFRCKGSTFSRYAQHLEQLFYLSYCRSMSSSGGKASVTLFNSVRNSTLPTPHRKKV